MDNVEFSIVKSSMTIKCSDGEIYQLEDDKELIVFGDLIGAIHNRVNYKKEELISFLIKTIANSESDDKVMSSVIGPCYVVVSLPDQIDIFASCSSPGLFYHYSDGTYHFSNSEKDMFTKYGDEKNLDEHEMLASIVSHQILLRNPFTTIFKDISRIPGGGSLHITTTKKPSEDLFILDLNAPSKSRVDFDEFVFLLESTLNLLLDYYKDQETVLLKSGGIDSAVLLAALGENKIPCVHLPYGGDKDPQISLARDIVEYRGFPFRKGSIQNNTDLDRLINLCKSGLGTIPGPQYLRTSLEVDFNAASKIIALSGQNIDTLYHVDTFAPGSIVTGIIKYIRIFKSIKKRVFYSRFFLRKLNLGVFLSIVLSIKRSKHKRSFTDYLKSICLPAVEHSIPFSRPKFSSHHGIIEDNFKSCKTKGLFQRFISIVHSREINLDELSSGGKIHLIKVLRWCRTIQNVPVNYQNLEFAGTIQRIIPYTQGPIANFFLHYELSLVEMVKIKELSHRYFEQKFGRSHGYFAAKQQNSLLTYVKQKMKPKKNQEANYDDAFKILNQLIDASDTWLGSMFKDNDNHEYIINLYKKLEHHEKHNWKKAQVMEICRFVNLNLLMQGVLRKGLLKR